MLLPIWLAWNYAMILVSEVALFCNPVDLQILQQFASLDTYLYILHFSICKQEGVLFLFLVSRRHSMVSTQIWTRKSIFERWFRFNHIFKKMNVHISLISLIFSSSSIFMNVFLQFALKLNYVCIYCFEKSAKTSFYSFLLFSSICCSSSTLWLRH